MTPDERELLFWIAKWLAHTDEGAAKTLGVTSTLGPKLRELMANIERDADK